MAGKPGQTQARKYHAVCAECGKEFCSARPQTKYCCEKCAAKAHRKAKRAKEATKAPEKVYIACPVCGEKFLRYHNQVYCSRSCAKIGKRKHMFAEPKNVKQYAIIRIVRQIPVKPELCPKVGKMYEAYICPLSEKDPGNYCFIIPEIGQHGLIVRKEEAVILDMLGSRQYRAKANVRKTSEKRC